MAKVNADELILQFFNYKMFGHTFMQFPIVCSIMYNDGIVTFPVSVKMQIDLTMHYFLLVIYSQCNTCVCCVISLFFDSSIYIVVFCTSPVLCHQPINRHCYLAVNSVKIFYLEGTASQ